MFQDTQIAVAEVFGHNVHHHHRAALGRRELRRNDSVATDGETNGNTRNKEMVNLDVLSYTDFVMKLENALSKPDSTNDDPWVRWLVPLHRQYHR